MPPSRLSCGALRYILQKITSQQKNLYVLVYYVLEALISAAETFDTKKKELTETNQGAPVLKKRHSTIFRQT